MNKANAPNRESCSNIDGANGRMVVVVNVLEQRNSVADLQIEDNDCAIVIKDSEIDVIDLILIYVLLILFIVLILRIYVQIMVA